MNDDEDNDYEPSLLYTADEFLLVWVSNEFDQYTFMGSTDENLITYSVSSDGLNWNDPESVHPRYCQESTPYLSVDSIGRILLTWSSDRMDFEEAEDERDHDKDIWYSTYAAGEWAVPSALTSDPANDESPSMFQKGNGDYWTVWSRDDRIFYSTTDELPPPVNAFGSAINVPIDRWREEFDYTYEDEISNTFWIYNYGERDLTGKITASQGFTLNKFEFAIAPGENISFTVTLNAKDEGRYLGVVEILSNDEIAPRISIPLYVKITSSEFEESEKDIGEGVGPEEEEAEEEGEEDFQRVLILLTALVIILLLIFIVMRREEKKAAEEKKKEDEEEEEEKEEEEGEEKEGEEGEEEGEGEEEEEGGEEEEGESKGEEGSEVEEDAASDEDVKTEEKEPEDKGAAKAKPKRKRAVKPLMVFGAFFSIMILLLSNCSGAANMMVLAQDSDIPQSEIPKISENDPGEFWTWVPYYDQSGEESNLEMHSEYYDDEGTYPPDWVEYGSSLSLRQLVEMPFPVEKLRFWMRHDEGSGPVGVEITENVSSKVAAGTEYFWADYSSSSYDWCEVNVSTSKITNVLGGGSYYIHLTPPMDILTEGEMYGVNRIGTVKLNDTPIPPAHIVYKTLYDAEVDFAQRGTDKYQHIFWTSKIDDTVLIDEFFMDYDYYDDLNPQYMSDSLWYTDNDFNMKMELYIKAEMFNSANVFQPSYPGYENAEIAGKINIVNPFSDQENFTVRVGLLGPDGTEYNVLNEEHKIKYGTNLQLDYSYFTEAKLPAGDYNVLAGIYLTDIYEGEYLVMADKWGDTDYELEKTKFSIINTTPIMDVTLIDKLKSDVVDGKIPVYYLKCSDAPGHKPPRSIQSEMDNIQERFDSLESVLGVDFEHKDITSTREFLELVESDVKDAIVVNYHSDLLPIPSSFARGEYVDLNTIVRYYFDENNGTTVYDRSKYINDADFVGNPAWTQEKYQGASALYFDGSNDMLEIDDDITLKTPRFTIQFWLYLNKEYTSGVQSILSYAGSKGGYEINLNQTSSNAPNQIEFSISHNSSWHHISGMSLEVNKWYRITAILNDTEASLYVGWEETKKKRRSEVTIQVDELQGKIELGGISFSDTSLTIGGSKLDTTRNIEMYIDDFILTNDVRLPQEYTEGHPEDGVNWVKRVGKWIADSGIVFVNTRYSPFTAVGNTDKNWPYNRISLGAEGFGNILETRSVDATIYKDTWLENIKTDKTPEAANIQTILSAWGIPFPDSFESAQTYMTLDSELEPFCIPLYKTADNEITHAMIFYGKGAIMYNGLNNPDAALIAGTAGWYTAKNIQPLYFIDCSDAPKSSSSKDYVTELKSSFDKLQADTGIQFYYITISSTDQFYQLINSNVRDIIVVNTHGEYLPMPANYISGACVDDKTNALLGFEEGSDISAFDISGNYNDGLIVGATWSTNAHYGDYALDFDGNDFVVLTRTPKLSPKTFTIECSVYLKQDYDNKSAAIISNEFHRDSEPGEEYTHTYGYSLYINSNYTTLNRLVFSLGTKLPEVEPLYFDSLEKERWYRLAATYDGRYMKLYVNYEEVASKVAYGLHPETLNNLQIGKCPRYDYPINAIIDDVRISEGALSPDQMLIDVVSHKLCLEDLNRWISESSIIWTNIEGYDFLYLGLKDQDWPDDRVNIGYDGLSEFSEIGLPPLELNTRSNTCTLTDVGDKIDTDLASMILKSSFQSTANIPASYDMFTIPIYSNDNAVSHGVIPIGKGKFIHTGTYDADLVASTAAWFFTKGNVQMIFLVDIPATVGGTDPLVVESQHPYPTRFGTSENLIDNPGAESGSMSGWKVLLHGGNGWRVQGGSYDGEKHFRTSFNWCKRYQEIDLLAEGYTTDELNAKPTIYAEEWFHGSWPNYGDYYYLKVELRDANHKAISTYNSGVQRATNSWQKLSHTFSEYGAGVRYIYWEDGGDDAEYWWGYYGVMIDGAFLTIDTAELDDTWVFYKPDVSRIRVHFEKYEIGSTGDYIKVLNKNDCELARYSGFDSSGMWTPWCEGDTVKLKMVTGSGRHYWGFKVNKIEYLTDGVSPIHPYGKAELINKLTNLENTMDTICIFNEITSTAEFEKLVESRLESPMVINLHGDAVPVPDSYLTGGASATIPPLGYSPGGVKGEYYDNEGFTNLKETRVDNEINFYWKYGRPVGSVHGDTFSVRWTGMLRVDFSEEYTFHVQTDDGTRFWIDKNMDGDFDDAEELVIDTWKLQAPTWHQGKIKLTPGFYNIKYEYYEHYGYAVAKLFWSSKNIKKSAVPGENLYSNLATPAGYTSGGLEGEYYDNADLKYLKTKKVDSTINFNWGTESPDAAVDPDTLSIRWTGMVKIDETGEYEFSVNTDDGSRLWVNNQQIINSWKDQSAPTEYSGKISFTKPGFYDITYEYFKNTGSATAQLYWKTPSMTQDGEQKVIIPSDHLFNRGGIFRYAQEWLNELGDWVAQNGVVYANTKDYPFQYAIIDNPPPDSGNLWFIGEEGFSEFLSPRSESVTLARYEEGLGMGNLTPNGRALRDYLPARTLPNYVTDVPYPLPSDYDCIPIFRDKDNRDITHGIIPFGRGAYIHCGGFSVDALTAMCFMYSSKRDDMRFIGEVYYKGETVWTQVQVRNDYPMEMTYDFELVTHFPEEGLRSRRMTDSEIVTLQPGEEKTIYLSWTPIQPDKIGKYSLVVQVIDLERHTLVEIWGNDIENESISISVEVGAYISQLKTSDYLGYFDTVEVEVTITNEMYIDNLFIVSGIFQNKINKHVYWTEEEELPEYEAEGGMDTTVTVVWHPSQHNYPNQTFELGIYQGTIFLEDVASAYCIPDKSYKTGEPKYFRVKKIIDQSSTEFRIVGQLEINFPKDIGTWSISYHGELGPYFPINPQVRDVVRVFDPEYDIWIRRDSRLELEPEREPGGMIGYWKFDESVWTVDAGQVTDSSGNGHHGTAYNGANTVQYSRFGRSAAFNGQNYVVIPAHDDINVGNNNANFSVEFWFFLKQGPIRYWRNIMHKGSTNSERTFAMWMKPWDNKIHARISTTHNVNEGFDSKAYLQLNSWTHVAYVKDGNTLSLYLNGKLDTKYTLVGSVVNNSGPLYIGKDMWYNGVNSHIDELCLYNRPIYEDEIKLHYKSGVMEASDRNAFKLGYYSDSGNDLYAVVNFESQDDGNSYQKVLKLPADGNYLDVEHLFAYYWPEGTTLKISQEPNLQFSGTEYFSYNGPRPTTLPLETTVNGVDCAVLYNRGAGVTYDVVLNDANFYKIFITAQNCPKSEAGDIKLRLHLHYWTGNPAHKDSFGNVGWKTNDESPKDFVWSERNEEFDTKEFRLILSPAGHYHITIENLHDYYTKDYDKNAYISEVAIRPTYALDMEKQKVDESQMLASGEAGTRSISTSSRVGEDGPIGNRNCDLGVRPKKVPDETMDYTYNEVPIPMFGANYDMGSPGIEAGGSLPVKFGDHVGLEIEFGLEIDPTTGLLQKISIGITLGIEGEIGGIVKIAAKIQVQIEFDDILNTSKPFIEKFKWSVTVEIEVGFEIGKLIWKAPISFEVPKPGGKEGEDESLLALKLCLWIELGFKISLHSGANAGDVQITAGIYGGIKFEVKFEVKITPDILKGLTQKSTDMRKENTKALTDHADQSQKAEELEEKRENKIKEMQKDNKDKPREEIEKLVDESPMGKQYAEEQKKKEDSFANLMKSSKKLSECNKFKDIFEKVFGKGFKDFPTFLEIEFTINFVIGLRLGVSTQVAPFSPTGPYWKLLFYTEFFFAAEISFKIIINIWIIKLEFPIGFKFWIDKIFWMNKVNIIGASEWDDDGVMGQFMFKCRENIDDETKDMMLPAPIGDDSGFEVVFLWFKFKFSFCLVST
ncbi:MAG: hypothetical protein JSV49_02755 [Thermoplasmata archaeon]|nr:MAG: hypothetical protein JSV49_02755 [Thermoplasmata archaeon]